MSTRSDIIDSLYQRLLLAAQDPAYPIEVMKVFILPVDPLNLEFTKLPAVVIEDTGVEIIQVSGTDGYYRMSATIRLHGIVVADTSEDLPNRQNLIRAWIQRFCDSTPDLGSNCLAFQLGSSEAQSSQSITTTPRAIVTIPSALIYYQTIGGP